MTARDSVQGLRRAETPATPRPGATPEPLRNGEPGPRWGPKEQKLQGGGCAGAADCRSARPPGHGRPGEGPAGSEPRSAGL